ncbi:Golgi to ER traffic protein 2 [Staphylotrichum tortipilum]|uniref:Golgi to ER traffic protein 2 n=1 Tax=Staphylotrichum tortipilum TaxID=2831512 RepID=A0AAN6MQV0_9PEZI|nr:Golgi to ER traffic protein 2 [Staphylotrichum longicolle]
MTELSPDEEAASARAAEQARLRKARREAKIKAGAENRLNRITGLGGRVPPEDAKPEAATTATATSTTTPAPTPAPAPAQVHHADPEEVDISEHFYQPATTARVPPPAAAARSSPGISDAQLRQMMLGTATPPPAGPGMGMGGMPQPPPGMEDDPMMRMMMQMLGGGGSALGGGNPFGFPPTAQPPAGGAPTVQPQTPTRAASMWRILHALLALTLGLTIALTTPFTGTKSSRDRAAAAAAGSLTDQLTHDGQAATKNFFWAFATAEALLLTTRHVVERGRSRLHGATAGGSGILGAVVGFLPAGIKGKVELAMRYGEVAGAVRGDVLVCVFVLGVVGWWRG